MAVEVRLDNAPVYQTSFQICHAVRDTALDRVQRDTRLSFSFKPSRAIVWKGYRSDEGETTAAGRAVQGEVWEAGADPAALLLGVTFAVADTLHMNSVVVASPTKRVEDELAKGLFVTTYPIRRTVPPDRASGPWTNVTQNPSLKVSLDTSRIVSDSLGTTVWLRFDYTATNPAMTDMPQPWRQMESRHVLDCAGRRAKDIAMVIIDTAGARHNGSHVLSSTWQPFDKHPLTGNLLASVCATVETVRTRRGT